ncbi:hypothetical protein [Nitratidesulfovibrio vulgaris]|uniref:hypothetical protein n=1 Tax=Nitratidesulfovibrio vulgaris TaxID=881 RepID=UPI0022FFFF09|nr:hypothetical protein [Nitratidesulfovibrio vulgaris]WCB45729.1 hypothetical protein PH214_11800 [Nitratidesulfovibrio vulgaris]
MEKMLDAFKVVETNSPMPSIEVDVDSTEDENHRAILERSLMYFAEENPGITASIYDYCSPSTNFGHMTNSVFFIVAKTQSLLKYIHTELRAAHTLKMRFGDYIPPSKGRLAYHIESGQAWRLDDAVTFTLLDDWGGDKRMESAEYLPQEESPSQGNKRPAARTYRARSDASVGSIKSRIEEVFGLPEGSVALCAPDGKSMRSDAKIKTLRNRWEGE